MDVEFSKNHIYDGKVEEREIYRTQGSRPGYISEVFSYSLRTTLIYLVAAIAFIAYYHKMDVPLFSTSSYHFFLVVAGIIAVVLIIRIFSYWSSAANLAFEYECATIELTNRKVTFTDMYRGERQTLVLEKIDSISIEAKDSHAVAYNYGTIVITVGGERYWVKYVEEPEKFVEIFYEAKELKEQEKLHRDDSFYNTREHQYKMEKYQYEQLQHNNRMEKRQEELLEALTKNKLQSSHDGYSQIEEKNN